MKKNALLIILVCLISTGSLFAQQIEISPSAGYMVNGKINFYEGILDLGDAPSFGVTVGMATGAAREFELDYTWASNADLTFTKYNGFPSFPDFTGKVNIHNITLNGIQYLSRSETVNTFANFGAGMAIFDVEENGVETRVRFLVNFGLGMKYYFSERVGIKIQARMLLPLYFSGVGFYFGGGGSGLTLNSMAPIVQGDFRGGLVFRVGQ